MHSEIASGQPRRGRRSSSGHVPTKRHMTNGAEHETGGQVTDANHPEDAPAGEGQSAHAHQYAGALSTTCDALKHLQRKRRFCIVSQSRCDRSCETLIASVLGYRTDMAEAARKAVWQQARKAREAIETGEDDHNRIGGSAVLSITDIVRQSAVARGVWDNLREKVETDMRKLARTLPVYAWANGVRGFGDLGLAIIIGETGDLSLYETKERVWKRLGLAVIDGIRQQRRSDPDEAAAHGYNPKRRAEIWALTDSLSRHQWRSKKDDVPAHAIGPYGEVYGRRKADRTERNNSGAFEEWALSIAAARKRAGKKPAAENLAGRLTKAHINNDARRIMAKALVADLWAEWRRSGDG